ncbi:MAG: ROK family protein [Eubacteriales bacterium]|nr:ROK family protein [Eubacteriales bacterium]
MADAGKLKQVNTALLRQAMRGGGEYSKNDLARETGLSFPTVSRIIDELAETGELRETGAAASTGGRCAKQYALDPAFRLFLCMRLEGYTLRHFVCDLAGARLEEQTTDCRDGILQAINTLLMRVRARYPQLAAVALGFAGTMRDGKAMDAFGYPELRGVSLKSYLEDKAGLPAAAERDMHLVSAGYCACAADKPRALVCVYLGDTGMGASVALDGRAFRGANEFAGELHYLPIKNNLEYARTHFAGADMVAYYMQVIRAYAVLVNPDRVVLYENELLAGKVDRIRAACEKTLPPQAMPVIELSDTFVRDYEAGLLALAHGLVREDV